MLYLNYILFLLFVLFVWQIPRIKSHILCSPLEEEYVLQINGVEVLWLIMFATGVVALAAPGVLDLMALRLLALEVVVVGLLFRYRRAIILNKVFLLYFIMLGWFALGILYAPSFTYGIRTWLKFLYPPILGMLGMVLIDDIRMWLKSVLWARYGAVISLIYYFVPFIDKYVPGFIWYFTAVAVNYISMLSISMGLMTGTERKWSNLIWCIVWLLPCVLWGLRSSMLGSIVAVVTFLIIKLRWSSLPFILGIVFFGIISIVYIPSIKEKTFGQEKIELQDILLGRLTFNQINTNARSNMWGFFWEEYVTKHPIVGSGTGAIQSYMYENHVFGGLKMPHNDYLQILCDNGFMGLLLYLTIFGSAIRECFRIKKYYACYLGMDMVASTTGAALAGVGVTLLTENTVAYSVCTLAYPWALYGMMIGIKRKYEYYGSISSHTDV